MRNQKSDSLLSHSFNALGIFLLRIEFADLIAVQQDRVMSLGNTAQVQAGMQRSSQWHQGAGFVLLCNAVSFQADLILCGPAYFHAQLVTRRGRSIGEVHCDLRICHGHRAGFDLEITDHQIAVARLGCIGIIEVQGSGGGFGSAR